ncbi:MAG: hypothetical protein KJN66_04595 [Bacteroidia bacterium]|nr:hypothetical protein [Bacteroidia bacterium]
MKKFKKNWEISKNWQLLFPFLGLLGLLYTAYKISLAIFKVNVLLNVVATILLFYVLIKVSGFTLKKLENRWEVSERWQIIRIFIIFAITGTSSLYVSSPILNAIGLTKDVFDFNIFSLSVYYVLKFLAILPVYQILLLFFGWLLGEYKFFSTFVNKMLSRFKRKKSTKKE